jgi:hypothetical protein
MSANAIGGRAQVQKMICTSGLAQPGCASNVDLFEAREARKCGREFRICPDSDGAPLCRGGGRS